jgi:hypothetical protein
MLPRHQHFEWRLVKEAVQTEGNVQGNVLLGDTGFGYRPRLPAAVTGIDDDSVDAKRNNCAIERVRRRCRCFNFRRGELHDRLGLFDVRFGIR